MLRRAVHTNCEVHHKNILLTAVRISRCPEGGWLGGASMKGAAESRAKS
jgi:hypothetical protein